MSSSDKNLPRETTVLGQRLRTSAGLENKVRAKAAVLAVGFALTCCGQAGPRTLDEVDPIIRGVDYVGLAVDNLAAAERYYAGSLATTVVDATRLPAGTVLARLHAPEGGAAQTRLLRRTNAQLRLFRFAGRTAAGRAATAVPVQGPGIAHVCFQVGQQTHSHDRMLATGGTPLGRRELVQLNDRNPVYYGYVRDPAGVISEIEEVDLAKLDRPKPPANLYRVRHVSLATPDLGRMMAFYSAFLGGQEARHVGRWIKVSGEKVDQVSGLQGSRVEMAWFQLRNLEIEIFQYHSHPTATPATPRPLDAPGYNMIVFDVSNLTDARRRLLAAGGTIVTPEGDLDGGRIIFGRDPDGNLIGLQTLPRTSVLSAENFQNNGS